MMSQLAVLVVLILLNALFASTEIAFISLNDAKINKQAKEGDKKAKQIAKMLKNPSKFLATIQQVFYLVLVHQMHLPIS